MDQTVHTCTGGCGAVITQEQYDQGLTACGAQGCNHHGQPFEKRIKCGSCGVLHKEGETHTCQ